MLREFIFYEKGKIIHKTRISRTIISEKKLHTFPGLSNHLRKWLGSVNRKALEGKYDVDKLYVNILCKLSLTFNEIFYRKKENTLVSRTFQKWRILLLQFVGPLLLLFSFLFLANM